MSMEVLTIKEASALLEVSPATVRRYIADGRLPAVRVGNGVRVSREAVERLPSAVEPKAHMAKAGRPFTMDDPLWSIMGMAESDGPTDVSENKHKYLAEAYADLHKGE